MREPVLPSGIPEPLNRELLAWAAGFFDGEGSTVAKSQKSRPDYWQVQVSVPQSGNGVVPEVLQRFRAAALETGRIDPPNDESVYAWRARGRIDAETTLALMWPYLGEVKRAQALAAIALVDSQYADGRIKKRPPRFVPNFVRHPLPPTSTDGTTLDRAWAAGFLDAEGWFGVVRGRKRKDGSASFRIRVSAPQHSSDGQVPAVLVRLSSILGLGTIECHGEPDDYKWVAYGREAVERVMTLTQAWLGDVKMSQAHAAFERFDSQPRTRSRSDTTCARGHTYDRIVIGGDGKVRKFCNACARMKERERRAANGGKARTVRRRPVDTTRTYWIREEIAA